MKILVLIWKYHVILPENKFNNYLFGAISTSCTNTTNILAINPYLDRYICL